MGRTAFDGNGNTTSDGTYTFAFDPENRLVSAGGAGSTASYAFDGRGRRKSKTVNGTTTISVTDAQNREVMEYDGSTGAIQRWYAYGVGPNALLNQMNVALATRSTMIPDQLGSIIGLMDSATGALSSFAYRTYGSNATAPPQFGYTGQRVDAETGTYYYRARHYSPGWGRFLQADPIGYQGGAHLYAYVENDPLNAVDPHGLLLEDAGNTASGLASDFYQQSILKPISDIQGYANDLLTNPAYFFQNASGALASVAPEFQSISTLFGSVGSGIAAESGFGVAGRVAELQEAIPLAQQGWITMAVGLAEDANGMQQVLIGTSEPMGYLRPGVTLNPGEILAPGLGHAEADIINFAQQNGFNLLEVGATRPICASCASLIEGAGATPVTPLKVP